MKDNEYNKNIMDEMMFPNGHDFIGVPYFKRYGSKKSSTPDCTECDNPNPEECRLCLEAFESSRPKELNPGNANLIAENKSLKKLFIEMYKESVEYKKSIALLKSRETNPLKKVDDLKCCGNCDNEDLDDTYNACEYSGKCREVMILSVKDKYKSYWKSEESTNAK